MVEDRPQRWHPHFSPGARQQQTYAEDRQQQATGHPDWHTDGGDEDRAPEQPGSQTGRRHSVMLQGQLVNARLLDISPDSGGGGHHSQSQRDGSRNNQQQD